MSRTIKVVAYHEVEVSDEWLFAIEEDGIDPDNDEGIIEWIEDFKSLSDFETHREITS